MRRFAGICAAVGIAAVGAVAAMPAAQGAPTTTETSLSTTGYADCPVGWFCVWEHANGEGKMARFQTGSADLRDFGMNDKISSAWNRLGNGKNFCTWLDINYKGGTWEVGNWQGNTSQYGRNDNISSLKAGKCP
jgi:hypothetical protein